MKAVVLKCKNCGGNLTVAGDAKMVHCRYCKAQHQIIKEQDGSVDYEMLEAGVQQLVNKQNARLRIPILLSKRNLLLDQIDDAGNQAREIESDYSRGELLIGLLALFLGIGVLLNGRNQSIRFWGFIAGFPIGALLTVHVFSEKRKLKARADKHRTLAEQYRSQVSELDEEIACLKRILDKPITPQKSAVNTQFSNSHACSCDQWMNED